LIWYQTEFSLATNPNFVLFNYIQKKSMRWHQLYKNTHYFYTSRNLKISKNHDPKYNSNKSIYENIKDQSEGIGYGKNLISVKFLQNREYYLGLKVRVQLLPFHDTHFVLFTPQYKRVEFYEIFYRFCTFFFTIYKYKIFLSLKIYLHNNHHFEQLLILEWCKKSIHRINCITFTIFFLFRVKQNSACFQNQMKIMQKFILY